MSQSKTSLQELSGLRFISAFLVVAYHYAYFPELPNWINRFISYGSKGVTFFFLLSGFILSYRYSDEDLISKQSLRKFYVARFSRIMPVYWLSLLLSIPLLYKLIWMDKALGSDFTFLKSILVFDISILGLQSWLPIEPIAYGLNTPAWSISVELVFYAFFPLLLCKLKKSSVLWPIFWIIYSIGQIMIFDLLPKEIWGYKGTWANHPFFCLPLFIMGMSLYEIYKFDLKINFKIISYFWMALTLGYYFSDLPQTFIRIDPAITAVLFSGMILFYAKGVGPGSKMLSHSLTVLLGEASYSLYIFQAPLKFYFQQIYSKILGLENTLSSAFSIYILACLVISSLIIYKTFELKMRDYIKLKFS